MAARPKGMKLPSVMLVSPAEPGDVKAWLGSELTELDVDLDSSQLTEAYGVDFLWRARGTWWGVQRKTVPDLVSSMTDGRLPREVAQMKARVSMPIIVIEGPVQFANGHLMNSGWGQDVTVRQWRGLMFTFASHGISVMHSSSKQNTLSLLIDLMRWTSKAKHTSLTARPIVIGEAWGDPTSRDYGKFVLMGVDGIGPELAGAIFDHFGGVPLEWTVSYEELLEVDGIGPERAAKMMRAIGRQDAKA